MCRVDEVTFQERADVGGKDAVEESGELGPEWGGIRSKTDDGGGYDERRKERDHGGVGARTERG